MEKSEGNRNVVSFAMTGKAGMCEEQLMQKFAKAVSHFCGYSFYVRKTYAGYFIFRK